LFLFITYKDLSLIFASLNLAFYFYFNDPNLLSDFEKILRTDLFDANKSLFFILL
jgi:hypothetical protein